MKSGQRLFVLLCLLCLLGAQQAAHAHWIGHGGAAGVDASAPGDDGDAPGHGCANCAAYAALAAAPPPCFAAAALPSHAELPARASYAHVPARPARPYASRAPPAVL